MHKSQKEHCFYSLPKVLKEEIFVFLGDAKEIGRLRRVSKTFKEIIDKSNRIELKLVSRKGEEYFESGRKRKERQIKREKDDIVGNFFLLPSFLL